ncbi:MAG: hypothetical protein DHS20C05_00970 [Hyphococcus sp.]|nr:MAG: hypothetical protein DHS20C05_00970 [Marinicaulis sp.]
MTKYPTPIIPISTELATAAQYALESLRGSNSLDTNFPKEAVSLILRSLSKAEFGTLESFSLSVEYSYARLLLTYSSFYNLELISDAGSASAIFEFETFEGYFAHLILAIKRARESLVKSESISTTMPLASLSQLTALSSTHTSKISHNAKKIRAVVSQLESGNFSGNEDEVSILADVSKLTLLVEAEHTFPKRSLRLLAGLSDLIAEYPKLIRQIGRGMRAVSAGMSKLFERLEKFQKTLNEAIVSVIDEIGTDLVNYKSDKEILDTALLPDFDFQIDVTITYVLGVHIRASRKISALAEHFSANIYLVRSDDEQFAKVGRIADARSQLDLLMLTASNGVSLRIGAIGQDAREACIAVKMLIEAEFFQRSKGDIEGANVLFEDIYEDSRKPRKK